MIEIRFWSELGGQVIFVQNRLGLENRLAGSVEFLAPDFQKGSFYPPPELPPQSYLHPISILALILLVME